MDENDKLRATLSTKERWLVPRWLVPTRRFYFLKERIIESMTWMTECMKWKYRQEKNIPDDVDDCNVDYSPELRKAMNLLKELCE